MSRSPAKSGKATAMKSLKEKWLSIVQSAGEKGENGTGGSSIITGVVQLYRDQLFMNIGKVFTSQDLSLVMAVFSLPCVQFSLTIRPWHHIQTAWKCKFKCAVKDIVKFDGEEDMDTLQAGHTHAMENHIYGLSVQSLGALLKMSFHCFCKPALPGKNGVR